MLKRTAIRDQFGERVRIVSEFLLGFQVTRKVERRWFSLLFRKVNPKG